MKVLLGLSITAGLLGVYLLTSAASAAGREGNVPTLKDHKRISGKHRTPVLVELFTSEGCSSCPAADAELAKLVRDQPVADAEIIPFSEHVDYWNGIGWKDPFSSAQFSARQHDYGEALRLDSVYTPQMIVDGHDEFLGSDEGRANVAIRNASKGTKANVEVGVYGTTVKVAVSGAMGKRAEVLLAITEDGLSSNVRAGENGGRHLSHVAVVRSLHRIGTLDSRGAFAGSFGLDLKPNWKRSELSAVAFVQETGSRRVLGAAQTEIGAS